MKPKELVRHELIGLYIVILDSSNKTNIGIKGKIVDETKFTIVINHNNTKKRLFKNNITMNVYVNKNIILIQGKSLIGRPKDRTNNWRIK